MTLVDREHVLLMTPMRDKSWKLDMFRSVLDTSDNNFKTMPSSKAISKDDFVADEDKQSA